MGHNKDADEPDEILLQSLPYSYDQLILNLTNNLESVVFDDVGTVVLEEESWTKNKEDRLTS